MEKIGLWEVLVFIGTLFGLVVSYICARRAKRLNRDMFLWALFGFSLPLIAIIVVMMVKPRVRESQQESQG